MKKFFKILFILMILIILIVLINAIRNVYIISKIRKNENKYFSDISSYNLKIESHFSYYEPNSDNNVINETDIKEIYFKDNVYLVKNYKNGQLINTENNASEKISNYFNSPNYTEIMKIDFIIKEEFSNNKIKLYLLNFIKSNDNNYILEGSEGKFYYNKDNGLLSQYYLNNLRYEIYSMEKNNVEDNDLENNNS